MEQEGYAGDKFVGILTGGFAVIGCLAGGALFALAGAEQGNRAGTVGLIGMLVVALSLLMLGLSVKLFQSVRWAFIVALVLAVLNVLGSFDSPARLVIQLALATYYGCRLAGAFGPPLV